MDTFEVSLLLPHGRPAAFQASTVSWQRDDRELMTPGSPAFHKCTSRICASWLCGNSSAGVWFSTCNWKKEKKEKNDKNELSAQHWTCDSLLSNHFRGHSKQGVRKRKSRWSRFCVYKKWVKRDMFLLAPRPNSFLFCYSMQNCVGELYRIFCNASMENHF